MSTELNITKVDKFKNSKDLDKKLGFLEKVNETYQKVDEFAVRSGIEAVDTGQKDRGRTNLNF